MKVESNLPMHIPKGYKPVDSEKPALLPVFGVKMASTSTSGYAGERGSGSHSSLQNRAHLLEPESTLLIRNRDRTEAHLAWD